MVVLVVHGFTRARVDYEAGKVRCAGAEAVRICSTSHVSVACGECCHCLGLSDAVFI